MVYDVVKLLLLLTIGNRSILVHGCSCTDADLIEDSQISNNGAKLFQSAAGWESKFQQDYSEMEYVQMLTMKPIVILSH